MLRECAICDQPRILTKCSRCGKRVCSDCLLTREAVCTDCAKTMGLRPPHRLFRAIS